MLLHHPPLITNLCIQLLHHALYDMTLLLEFADWKLDSRSRSYLKKQRVAVLVHPCPNCSIVNTHSCSTSQVSVLLAGSETNALLMSCPAISVPPSLLIDTEV